MIKRFGTLFVFVAVAALGVACGDDDDDDDNGTTTGGTNTTGSTTTTTTGDDDDDTTGSTTGPTDTSATGDDDTTGTGTDTATGDDDDTTGDTGTDPTAGGDCPAEATSCASDEELVSGICIKKPGSDATANGADPNISCVSGTGAPFPGPTEAYYEGCITAFGLDANTFNGCQVEVYRTENGRLTGQPLDTMTSTEVPRDRCNNRGLVRSTTGKKLPTNTLLGFKVTCTGFQDTYQFNRYFEADKLVDPPAGSTFAEKIVAGGEYDVNIIASSSWTLIPSLAGCGAIGEGFGAVAGAVRDCDRQNVAGATVGLSGAFELISYFEGTVPGPNRKDTDPSATYAICAVPEGVTRVGALAKKGATNNSLGTWDISVFSESVTILSFGGPINGAKPLCE
jgi:hypothetical protein